MHMHMGTIGTGTHFPTHRNYLRVGTTRWRPYRQELLQELPVRNYLYRRNCLYRNYLYRKYLELANCLCRKYLEHLYRNYLLPVQEIPVQELPARTGTTPLVRNYLYVAKVDTVG
tara:strand:- start:375 stop:719 length:345 start_codon:yes stop_codon:yes gene_type:complete